MNKIDKMLLELPLHLKKDELNYVLYVVHLVHEYEERIDKAIEYIKNNKYKKMGGYGDNEDEDIEICLFEDDINNLLNILTGGDE